MIRMYNVNEVAYHIRYRVCMFVGDAESLSHADGSGEYGKKVSAGKNVREMVRRWTFLNGRPTHECRVNQILSNTAMMELFQL